MENSSQLDSSMTMQHIAQTNLQLFCQMRGLEYSDQQISYISSAYGLAALLFSGRYRACGKPFVCHVVGTASIVAWLSASPEMIAAALLHAAYQEGDFGSGLFGMSPAKRRRVLQAIGVEAEALVAAYTASSRTLSALLKTHERFDEMSDAERKVLLLQLANELDDYRDDAAHFAANRDGRLDKVKQSVREQADMAEKLGYPQLAALIARVYRNTSNSELSEEFRSQENNAYGLVPLSCRKKWQNEVLYLLFRVRRKLRHIFQHG